jgi:hypothetical protein
MNKMTPAQPLTKHVLTNGGKKAKPIKPTDTAPIIRPN